MKLKVSSSSAVTSLPETRNLSLFMVAPKPREAFSLSLYRSSRPAGPLKLLLNGLPIDQWH
ncbi:MAG: hypothetical protein HAW66_08295 [Shewanella sp.]|nr:hypothetical protein [Shewanella sp.]